MDAIRNKREQETPVHATDRSESSMAESRRAGDRDEAEARLCQLSGSEQRDTGAPPGPSE